MHFLSFGDCSDIFVIEHVSHQTRDICSIVRIACMPS
jgi:hypothetical protein